MSTIRTASPDITQISINTHSAYREAVATLERLRRRRVEVEAATQEAVRAAEEADTQAVQAEAAVMIGEGDQRAAAAVRARFEQAQAKAVEAQRERRTLDEAIRIQEKKGAILLPEAREHVNRTARALHEPVMQRAVALLRQLAEVLQEHERVRQAVDKALGHMGTIAQPRFPDISFDKAQGGALITGTVDEVVRTLREAGYDV